MMPIAITAITEATPITRLRMVSAVRSLLWRTVSNASRMPSVTFTTAAPLQEEWPGRSPAAGSPARRG